MKAGSDQTIACTVTNPGDASRSKTATGPAPLIPFPIRVAAVATSATFRLKSADWSMLARPSDATSTAPQSARSAGYPGGYCAIGSPNSW